MKFVSSLLLAICALPAPVAADVTVGTVVLLNEGHQTDLKCGVEEHEEIQRAVTSLIPSMSGRRELNGVDCNLCKQYFPQDLSLCYFLYPNGQCSHLYRERRQQRQLRANTFKDDVTTHPKYQAKCKQQSKALERMVTKKSFLADFSPECGELLNQKMKFVCIVTED